MTIFSMKEGTGLWRQDWRQDFFPSNLAFHHPSLLSIFSVAHVSLTSRTSRNVTQTSKIKRWVLEGTERSPHHKGQQSAESARRLTVFKEKTRGQVWYHMPLIPALIKQRPMDLLLVPGQPSLHTPSQQNTNKTKNTNHGGTTSLSSGCSTSRWGPWERMM